MWEEVRALRGEAFIQKQLNKHQQQSPIEKVGDPASHCCPIIIAGAAPYAYKDPYLRDRDKESNARGRSRTRPHRKW